MFKGTQTPLTCAAMVNISSVTIALLPSASNLIKLFAY